MILKNLKLAALIIGAALSLHGAEISVFDAGNINTDSPYGLTENEKVLYEQRKQIEKLTKDLSQIRSQFDQLDSQVQGVRSVLDGTASKVGQSDAKTRSLSQKVEILDANVTALSKQIEHLSEVLHQTQETQKSNNEKIHTVLAELSSLIDSINSNYAPKSQVDELAQKVESLLVQSAKKDYSSLESKEGAVLIKEALEHFNANRLDEAKIRYEILVKKNYKPARSNFYLGEIAYKKEQWRTAIKHYKISIDLYDKADYIPRLLYHTAISFDKIGEPSNANAFYKALKTNYPNSKEAKASPDR
jgi:TolA-binding protein